MAGISATYISTNSFTVVGDQTSDFNTGRRCRATCSGSYDYGTIVSSSYSDPDTTVTLTATSDNLNIGLTTVYYGGASDEDGSLPEHLHDGTEGEGGVIDKYTQAEVDTISGTLSSEIDSDIATHKSDVDAHHTESHTVVSHSDTTATGAELDTLTDGSDTSLHIHDNRYYTESEVDTISGSLSSEIDSDISTHTSNADAHHTESHTIASHSDTSGTGAELDALTDGSETSLHIHDGRYYSESEIDTISGTLQTDIDTRLVKASNLSDVVSAPTSFDNIKQTATSSYTGVSELATDAETVTGTATDRVTTPANITAKMAAPGEIGGTTPAAGNFTTGDFTGVIEIDNDTWCRGENYAGTDVINMLKVNVDDEIDVGGSMNIGTIEGPEDGGAITLVDMPVSATTSGTEMSFTYKIDGDNIFTVGGESDGVGGVDGHFVKNCGANFTHGVTVAASTYTLLKSDYYLGVSYTATGTVAITLTTASLEDGRTIVITDEGGLAGTNNITVSTEGAEKISGADTSVINANYNSLTLRTNGSHWFIV